MSPGHYVLLTVTDEGTGMDAATQSRLFEPFFTTKPVGKGTGLGLSTIYGIVRQCQGTIWVYSELGKGTVFKIYLPVAQAAEAAAAAPAPAAEVAEAPITRAVLLLVEDDANLRSGFVSMLGRKGYEVLAAADGDAALELCRSHPGAVDLLLTDMIMPGRNGFELAQEVRTLRPNLRVLYMSGYTSDTLEIAGMGDGQPLNFIQKPFDTKTLLAKVREVLATPAGPR